MFGALAGVGTAWLTFTDRNITRLTDNIFLHFEITPAITGQALLVAAVLGILASIPPAIAVARMSVVAGVKKQDFRSPKRYLPAAAESGGAAVARWRVFPLSHFASSLW